MFIHLVLLVTQMMMHKTKPSLPVSYYRADEYLRSPPKLAHAYRVCPDDR
ncbi:hypothetical protein SAMN05428947_12060 [Mucilaginibacter sp. OK283]|nr:hypothetical protein SAMN05428947_12060 [Mucilaginibacter sp. OK283]